TIDMLKKAGCEEIRALVLVAAPEGIAAVEKAHPEVIIYTASIDERLDEHGYIVPGLGDAGDKIFGTKQKDVCACRKPWMSRSGARRWPARRCCSWPSAPWC